MEGKGEEGGREHEEEVEEEEQGKERHEDEAEKGAANESDLFICPPILSWAESGPARPS